MGRARERAELRGDEGGTKRVKQRGGAQDGAGLRGWGRAVSGGKAGARAGPADLARQLQDGLRARGKGSFRFPRPWSG